MFCWVIALTSRISNTTLTTHKKIIFTRIFTEKNNFLEPQMQDL